MKAARHRQTVYARQGGAKVHVVGNDRHRSEGDGVGRCGAGLWGVEYRAADVPAAERCRARACAGAWPAALRLVAGGL